MNFSAKTLLKLQRLFRVVKKELQIPSHINSADGISELLRRVESEAHNAKVVEMHGDFLSTLTEQDKIELISYQVSIVSVAEVGGGGVSSDTQNEDKKKGLTSTQDRRQHDMFVEHDRRKKKQYYRGVLVSGDRRLENVPYHGVERRGLGARQDAEEQHLSGQHTYHGRSYRGVAIEEEEAHPDKIKAKKKKPVRMYRGQPIYDD